MNIEQANGMVGRLELAFDRPYSPPARKKLVTELMKEPASACIKCVETFEQTESFLPAPAMLIQAVRQEAAAEREAESRKQAAQNQENKNFLSRKYDNEMAKLSVRLITAKLTEKIDMPTFLESFKHMEAKFPNVGWLQSGVAMNNFIENRKRLDELAASR